MSQNRRHVDIGIGLEQAHIVLAAIAGADQSRANPVIGAQNARTRSRGHRDASATEQIPTRGVTYLPSIVPEARVR
jgi:hypothetical protein